MTYIDKTGKVWTDDQIDVDCTGSVYIDGQFYCNYGDLIQIDD